MFNELILDELKTYKIREEEAIPFLLSLFYGYEPDYIPEGLKARVFATNIITYNEKDELVWNVPLFKEQPTNFNWVIDEYLNLFKHYGKDRRYKRECVSRMKKLFQEHPEIRKEDVLSGTELYIRTKMSEGTPSRYIINPHYFIEKGVGLSKTRELLSWIDLSKELREDKQKGTGSDKSITMQ